MDSSLLTNTQLIENALCKINHDEFYQRRAEMEISPSEFFEDVRHYLLQVHSFKPEDINYCVDTCLEYCTDLGDDDNASHIIAAINELVQKIH